MIKNKNMYYIILYCVKNITVRPFLTLLSIFQRIYFGFNQHMIIYENTFCQIIYHIILYSIHIEKTKKIPCLDI